MKLGISGRGKQVVSIALFVTMLVLSRHPAEAASAVTVGGPFELTAPDGRTVTDRTYRGKWMLVFFGYTSCPDTCPTTLVEITAALEQLGPAEAAGLQPIFITIDPKRDTPDVLKDYTQSFDPRIVGLTGTPPQIDAVAKEYGAFFEPRKTGPGREDYTLDHSTYLYLMDPQGQFVRGFDSDWSGDRIAAALHDLMAQT